MIKKNLSDKKSNLNLKPFWERVGYSFPSLVKAPSTRFYLECEKRLFRKYYPDLETSSLFKTDLWDEAKNTQILKWAADNGAKVYGIDISSSILKEAKQLFIDNQKSHKFVVSDVRNICFADNSFDYIYSMGTVEHFPDSLTAVKECFRVLKKGGTAIIGVPNKCDPFLRPAMVAFLKLLNLYAYGYERSFTRKGIEKIAKEAGFVIKDKDGILFIPGWLRMFDLFLHSYLPGLNFITKPFVAFFTFLSRKFPRLNRHGYLIACIVQKP
jgi:SAM-dependent methyltransferase